MRPHQHKTQVRGRLGSADWGQHGSPATCYVRDGTFSMAHNHDFMSEMPLWTVKSLLLLSCVSNGVSKNMSSKTVMQLNARCARALTCQHSSQLHRPSNLLHPLPSYAFSQPPLPLLHSVGSKLQLGMYNQCVCAAVMAPQLSDYVLVMSMLPSLIGNCAK